MPNPTQSKATFRHDLLMLYGIAALIAALAYLVALVKGMNAWGASPHGSALDVAVIAFVAMVTISSMAGLVFNNFAFLGADKDWQDFWSTDMLEYFTSKQLDAPWRIARGRFILFALTFASGFLIIRGYAFLIALT
ncbi:MAG TPA: hypothetical protein VIF60_09725 [Burkholderiaceae bacterium]|jgi:hypothetical protein